MPTTSSYYSDLEYPTVNEDASTYGTIINTYLDGLLTKLKTVSDRVTNAQAQLGNINRGVNAVDRINNTLAGAIGSSALLPSTGTTVLPDPYSGTYTKTTTWPAFTSELASYSPPTTQSEVENFDYQGFASALTTELNRIDATVTQAEADILAAQQDTCRAKKYIETYQSGGTLGWSNYAIQIHPVGSGGAGTLTTTNDGFTFTWSQSGAASSIVSLVGASSGNMRVAARFGGTGYGTPSSEGDFAYGFASPPVSFTGSSSALNTYFRSLAVPFVISTGSNSFTVNASSLYAGSITSFWNTRPGTQQAICHIDVLQGVQTFTTPDLTECENPNPPYFI